MLMAVDPDVPALAADFGTEERPLVHMFHHTVFLEAFPGNDQRGFLRVIFLFSLEKWFILGVASLEDIKYEADALLRATISKKKFI